MFFTARELTPISKIDPLASTACSQITESNTSVWFTLFCLNVLIVIKGTRLYILFVASAACAVTP